MLRPAHARDIDALHALATATGDAREAGYFSRCLAEQGEGKRDVIVAEQEGAVVGVIQLIWSPIYPPFRRLGIPEIQDLMVASAARRQGLGDALVAACEEKARAAGKADIGIGVGLYPRYGAAQRLYVRRGYMPDGAGICYDDVPVTAGELKPVDDLLTLKLVKAL